MWAPQKGFKGGDKGAGQMGVWKGSDKGFGKGYTQRSFPGPYPGSWWGKGGKGLMEVQADPWAWSDYAPSVDELQIPASGSSWTEETYHEPARMFSLARAPAASSVTVHNRYQALEESEDIVCEIESNVEDYPTPQEAKNVSPASKAKMTRWSNSCKKPEQCASCNFVDANESRERGEVGKREVAPGTVSYLGPGTDSAGGMISHIHDPCVGEWEELCAVMDSGAADSVAPCAVAEEVPMLESPGSRNGQQYMTADGTKLPNKGQKSFTAVTSEGRSIGVTYQMADVSRPLNSVGRICDHDNAVGFH